MAKDKRQITLMYPANLDMAKLIAEKLPEYKGAKGGINAHNLIYIIHCILSKYAKYKDDYLERKYGEKGMVSLCMEYLIPIVRNAKNCIDFLTANNIIDCDGISIKGQKCKYYSLNIEYTGHGIKYYTAKGKLYWNIIRAFEKKKKEEENTIAPIERRRGFLIRFLTNGKLAINEKEAIRAIKQRYSLEKRKAANEAELKQAKINFDRNLALMYKIKNIQAEIDVSIDEKGQRLHTPLTRMWKELRKYLRYDGKKLVALDIKNSQPYFMIKLLDGEFYKARQGKKSGVYLEYADDELNKLLRRGNNTNNSPIMLTKWLETQAGSEHSDVKNYIQQVVEGTFYNQFQKLKEGEAGYEEERTKVKHRIIATLYDIPRESGMSKTLSDLYPNVFKILNAIKSVETGRIKVRKYRGKNNSRIINRKPTPGLSGSLVAYPIEEKRKGLILDEGYTKLATLLQRIESNILLDMVCSNIHEQNPEIPLITIHDSIATTEEFVPVVEAEINKTLTEQIGYAPTLKPENWS